MVFWKTYPFYNIVQTKLNTQKFKSLLFERSPVESPTGTEAVVIKSDNTKVIIEVCAFLRNNFGDPPNTPILDIPEDQLLKDADYLMVLRDTDKNMVGCIRYHYIGKFTTAEGQEMYCEDCFCIHKKWRGRGVGDYLLTQLHIFVNGNNISPYSLFLKEGHSLSVVHSPIYSGVYVYRELTPNAKSDNVKSLMVDQAYRVMDMFREINRGMFIVRNVNTTNQIWKLWKKGTYKVLACFQDAYQRFEKNGKTNKIGWITGWIESPNMTDKYREEASKELSDSMCPQFNYIWANMEWIGGSDDWTVDGSFHWYSYQWSTCVSIKKSYCILN